MIVGLSGEKQFLIPRIGSFGKSNNVDNCNSTFHSQIYFPPEPDSIEPEPCTKMGRHLSEKCREKFPATTLRNSLVKIACLNDAISKNFELEAATSKIHICKRYERLQQPRLGVSFFAVAGHIDNCRHIFKNISPVWQLVGRQEKRFAWCNLLAESALNFGRGR